MNRIAESGSGWSYFHLVVHLSLALLAGGSVP